MKKDASQAGFTVLEMIIGFAIIVVLGSIYYLMVDSYKDRRMSEMAAKVLMQAAKAQEEFFAKEQRYFDAEVSGNGGEVYLTTPGGIRTSVRVPANIVLSLKVQGKEKKEFFGYAFFTGGKLLHRYDSKTGKITTANRAQDETG